jgi:hypothetical protein
MAYPLEVTVRSIVVPPARAANATLTLALSGMGSDSYLGGTASGTTLSYPEADDYCWFQAWADYRGESGAFRYGARG